MRVEWHGALPTGGQKSGHAAAVPLLCPPPPPVRACVVCSWLCVSSCVAIRLPSTHWDENHVWMRVRGRRRALREGVAEKSGALRRSNVRPKRGANHTTHNTHKRTIISQKHQGHNRGRKGAARRTIASGLSLNTKPSPTILTFPLRPALFLIGHLTMNMALSCSDSCKCLFWCANDLSFVGASLRSLVCAVCSSLPLSACVCQPGCVCGLSALSFFACASDPARHSLRRHSTTQRDQQHTRNSPHNASGQTHTQPPTNDMMRISRSALDRAAPLTRPILRSSHSSAVRLATTRHQIARPAAICTAAVRPFTARTAWATNHTTQHTPKQQPQQQQKQRSDSRDNNDDASSSSSSLPSSLLPLLRRLLTFFGVASVSAVGTFQLLAHTDILRRLGDSAGDHIASLASSACPPKHADLLLSPHESSAKGLPMPALTATNVILAINVAVFLMHQGLSPAFMHRHFYSSWSHLHASPPLYHTLLTSVFSHAAPMHLALNCYGLYLFGNKIEQDIGTKDFVLFYLAAGVLSSVGHLATARALGSKAYRLAAMSQPCLGASGAVFGLAGVATLLHPTERYSILGITPYMTADIFFPAMVGADFVGAMYYLWRNQLSSLGHWAHISGYLTGVAFAMTYLRAFNSKARAKMDVESKLKQLQAKTK